MPQVVQVLRRVPHTVASCCMPPLADPLLLALPSSPQEVCVHRSASGNACLDFVVLSLLRSERRAGLTEVGRGRGLAAAPGAGRTQKKKMLPRRQPGGMVLHNLKLNARALVFCVTSVLS